jgi:hydrogenase-4 component B
LRAKIAAKVVAMLSLLSSSGGNFGALAIFVAFVALVAGALLALLLPGNRARAHASLASQFIATVAIVVAAGPLLFGAPVIEASVPWAPPIGAVRLQIEALDAFFLCFSLPMTLLGSLYALGYLAPHMPTKRNVGAHFALLNLTSLSFLMIYALEHAFAFLIGWELAAIAAWLLVIFDHANQKIRFAGFNYLISTHLGFLLLLAALVIVQAQTGSTDLGDATQLLGTPGFMRSVVFVLLVTAFGLKSAFYPFHTWLPRAHAAAPAHVSALMSGVIHKAGLFALLKFTGLLRDPEAWMGWYLLGFSLLSAVMGALYTATQRDMKRMLGYSSTENVGIAGIGFGLGVLGLAWQQPVLAAIGFGGGLLHVLNHAIFKCLLFYAAGAVYRAAHSVDIERLGGLRRAMPQTAALFLVGGLAISALPPFNGFVSEFTIYTGLLGALPPTPEGRLALLLAAAALAFVGGVSALAIGRAFGIAFLGVPRDPRCVADGEAAPSMRATMFIHAAMIAVVGALPLAALALVRSPVGDLMRAHDVAIPAGALDAPLAGYAPVARMSLVLVGVFLLLVVLRRALIRASDRHVTWACGYPAPTSRIQYSGTSFADPFGRVFPGVLRFLRRVELPSGPFPKAGKIGTYCVDTVERRIFEVLGRATDTVTRLAARLPDATPASFAAGLVTLIAMIALLIGSGGAS